MSRGPAMIFLRDAARWAGADPVLGAWRGGTLLAALVLVALVGCPKTSDQDEASQRAVEVLFHNIDTQVRVYASEHKRAPTAEAGLEVLFDGAVPEDPWGNPVQYIVPGPEGHAFDLVSYGADGEPGGKRENADLYWSEIKE